jgi:hypothetical protein
MSQNITKHDTIPFCINLLMYWVQGGPDAIHYEQFNCTYFFANAPYLDLSVPSC